MQNVAFIKTGDGNITLILGSKNFSVGNSHPNYSAILNALKTKVYTGLEALLDIPAAITNSMGGRGVTVQDGQVFYNGTPMHNTITDRILSFLNEGLPVEPLIRFLENLMQNPSSRSVNELYDFLEHKGFPITEDGCFIGYKGIRADWKDRYSNSIDNSIGQKPRVERNRVDDNREHECSWGLHVGTLEYAQNYCSERIVLVKVNPADCVSVPKDHDASKLRVCGYEVIAEATARIDTPMWPMPAPIEDDGEDDFFDIEDEDDFDDEEDPFFNDQDEEDDSDLQTQNVSLVTPQRPPCNACGARGGKRHDPKCNRTRRS